MVKLEGRGLLVLRVASGLCALSLLLWTFHGVDFGRVSASVGGVGIPGLLLIAAPALLSLCLECVGWGSVFRSLGQRVAWRSIVRVRLMTEAVAQTLPLGVIWAESLKPTLLWRHSRVPGERAVAGLVARKYLLVGSQAVSVALCSAFGFATLQHLSLRLTGHAAFAWGAFGVSALLGCLAMGIGGAFARGRVAHRLYAVLRRVPNARLRNALGRRRASFSNTDGLTEHYFSLGFLRSSLRPGVFFLAGWLCESLESYFILKLLGVELDFFQVASVEVMLSFVKNVLFVLPSGIGVQDVGYVSCLTALGVPDALTVGAAFSALKRGKELFWAAVGYLLLASEARPKLTVTPVTPQLRIETA